MWVLLQTLNGMGLPSQKLCEASNSYYELSSRFEDLAYLKVRM